MNMADTKVTRASVEKANKATACAELKAFLDEQYGGCYEVEDGYAVPVGKSPLDGALMWVVFPYVKAKTIQTHAWGKSTREVYDGYTEAEAYAMEVKEKADRAAERKANAKAKAERDKAAREKRKAEKEKAE